MINGDTPQGDNPFGIQSRKTPWEVWLTGMTTLILLLTLGVLLFGIRVSGLSPEFTRTFLLVVIVFAALFLIVAGYTDQQAAPVYGLLGSIVGYIFGKGDSGSSQGAPARQSGSEAGRANEEKGQ